MFLSRRAALLTTPGCRFANARMLSPLSVEWSRSLSSSPGSGRGLLERAAAFLGLDEASRRKREQKRAIKEVVGAAFRGTGIGGRIWASLVSKFAVQVLGE